MNKRIKQYIPIREIRPELASNPNTHIGKPTHIELEVFYSLGGMNYFTGKPSARGYYISATPVEVGERGGGISMAGFVMGCGIKALLREVNRQTDKQLGVSCTLACEMAPQLLKWCENQYGIFCDAPETYFPNAVKLPVTGTAPKVSPRKDVSEKPAAPIRSMKLLTADIIRKLEKHPLGSQEGKGDDAEVLVKFFGGGAYTFLVTEGQKLDNGDWEFFGKATFGYEWEWGYVLLSEIEKMKFPPFGLGVERDMYLEAHATVGKLAA